MPRSASSLVSFRLTVDLGIPSNAAAFVRLRLSTTLPNTSRASMSKGRFCSTLFEICNRVLNPCTCFAHFHGGTFCPSRHQPDQGGSYDSRSPGEQARKRTLERRVSRTGRGPVSLEDCVSEEFYEKEREHVFKKTWLFMGRVERVPKSGSYFTRELKFSEHLGDHRSNTQLEPLKVGGAKARERKKKKTNCHS